MATRRSLHFVLKVADRTATAKFYREILGMKVLRHEEFEEGCKATCNGPYDGKWSKSMVGYGSEDNHFVVELTYNYGIKHYAKGNDYQAPDGSLVVNAPGDYTFCLHDKQSEKPDPVQSVSLGVSDLAASLKYWHELLGMTVVSQSSDRASLTFSEKAGYDRTGEVGRTNRSRRSLWSHCFLLPPSRASRDRE
ncbi:Glyoxalase domain-containing protein 4 [Geodia barretti]|uniref:Glyoxalase domain-containing protein 4 n=1 Tax=Geodia barretti TaxID=519541 RepID=A0AA35WMG5_GEOBA|nr:Glyoxalase domain-containing protein 4 [Geodia barretti]